MGEAKRRKEKGLPPKKKKVMKKSTSSNPLTKYPRLPLYIGLAFGIYLIFDLVKFN